MYSADHKLIFLGVIVDEDLSWESHIQFVCRKIAKNIGIMYKARLYLELNILRNLYYSFIYPYLSYGALIWGSNYKTKLKPIFILQKRALRAITFSEYRAPSKPIFEKLQILNIYEIVQYQLGELAFKHETNQIPTIFCSYMYSWET